MAKQDRRAGIRLPTATWEWLEAEADSQGTSVSTLIRRGIYLLQLEQQAIADLQQVALAAGKTYPNIRVA